MKEREGRNQKVCLFVINLWCIAHQVPQYVVSIINLRGSMNLRMRTHLIPTLSLIAGMGMNTIARILMVEEDQDQQPKGVTGREGLYTSWRAIRNRTHTR